MGNYKVVKQAISFELANFLLEKEVIFKEDLIRIYGERPFDPKDLVKKK